MLSLLKMKRRVSDPALSYYFKLVGLLEKFPIVINLVSKNSLGISDTLISSVSKHLKVKYFSK